LISSISKVHAKQVSIMTQWRRVKYENLKRKSTEIFDLEEKNWGFLTFGSHRWADLSCYNILHGWESIREVLNFLSFLKSLIFLVASIFMIFKMILSLTKLCLCYLEAVPFFWQLQTDNNHDFYLIIKFLYLTTNRVTIRS